MNEYDSIQEQITEIKNIIKHLSSVHRYRKNRDRDLEILRQFLLGNTLVDIARDFHIGTERVRQIIDKFEHETNKYFNPEYKATQEKIAQELYKQRKIEDDKRREESHLKWRLEYDKAEKEFKVKVLKWIEEQKDWCRWSDFYNENNKSQFSTFSHRYFIELVEQNKVEKDGVFFKIRGLV